MTFISITSDQGSPVEVDPDDVRTDTMRGSGSGGQHRNKTDSGVRLTHIPTGIQVTATEDRSQHVNRRVAWERLRTALDESTSAEARDRANDERLSQFGGQRDWTWCGWRDQVTNHRGRSMSMKRALRGGVDRLL